MSTGRKIGFETNAAFSKSNALCSVSVQINLSGLFLASKVVSGAAISA